MIEVVLETLFDDTRLQLTEKILRPIALGQPFILCSTYGSLKFLQDYGFKTFDSVFNEQYDTITDPYTRLNSVVSLMKEISQWDDRTQRLKMKQMQNIANYNQQHFFSKNFTNQITKELRINLGQALHTVSDTNTSKRFFDLRKSLAKIPELQKFLTNPSPQGATSRAEIAQTVKNARKYYNKHYNKY
jgi:hypothetical protein